ncbi:ATP-dependent DNA helicase [Nocardioides sp. R-C-SC26]|uniref:ATP-dependent DNA helicase n=1 Tax=Nocardioides sp. R-C-SC26 TaxID=2870414 RepID=UPI001E3639E1|nr:ATP-dependent DNA helicase [Nocardioides sp. R-C-SC26]
MSAAVPTGRPRLQLDTPEELQRAMGTPYAPSAEQWSAISAPLEPSVVIAGAGSGKTTLMAARVVYLVLTGQVLPEEVLGLTFTTKAASELRRRIHDALDAAGALSAAVDEDGVLGEPLEPTVATYNAYAAQLLTEHGLLIGHEPDTRVITDAARYQLGARVVDRFTGEVRFLTDHPPTAIQNLLALDGAMSEHLVSEPDVRRVDAQARADFLRELAAEVAGKGRKGHREAIEKGISAIDRRAELLELVAGYRRLKRDLGVMDFGDQISSAARLATERPEVGAAERARYRVVLLDEYQDTSVAQALLLGKLFSGPDVAGGRGHAVTAVGDPNQAIYGWRGASVSNIIHFDRTFPPAAGEPVRRHLTVSRRSQRRILDVANRLAAPLYAATEHVQPLQAAPGAGEGVVSTAVLETHRDELAHLVAGVVAAHERCSWSDIGVLTRDNAHAAEVFGALTAAGIPVEIVGLAGLLRLPEVAEVVATLHLVHDVTANPALVTLLTGPRWAIGPRDLKLLAERALEIAGNGSGRDGSAGADVDAALVQIADGVDPAELPALDDALADPGEADFSPQARERFASLHAELRHLRVFAGEPLLDLVRRIMDVSGVDVELAAAVGPAASARRDNLDLFVKAVADFQAVDGDVTLAALLAYLTVEDEFGAGLDIATPSEADSVKLLTVHRAKGLEWHSVFVVGVGVGRFPAGRARASWVSTPAVIPSPLRGDAPDLPMLGGYTKEDIEAYRLALRAHELEEDLRLAYVAYTRAAHELSVTSFCWSERATPFGPSAFQIVVRDQLEEWGDPVERWLDPPQRTDPNPMATIDASLPWPVPGVGQEAALRRAAALLVAEADPAAPDDDLDLVIQAQVETWDSEIERLLSEARRDRGGIVDVPMPASLSATAIGRLRERPEEYARELARPMPRPPAAGARFGSRFHAWVEERFGRAASLQASLLDTDELAGRGDAVLDDIVEEAELADLVAAFEAGRFAARVPLAVEAPFAMVLGGQVVRGRIDAVYRDDEPAGGAGQGEGASYLLVDWKTGDVPADPLQLAVYRLAWAELSGVEPRRVRAGFYYVRSGRLVVPEALPGRAELEALVGAAGRPGGPRDAE